MPNGIMGTSKPLIQLLDDESLSILKDIFCLAREGDASVDASNYRAQHEDSLEALNRLESYGLLRKENDRYRVSLVGLPLLGHQEADSLLAIFEQLFAALRQFYKSNQRDQLSLVDLAGVVNVPLHEVRKCLSYMVEGSWWGGRSNDFYASAEAYIKPSEAILGYKTFHNVILQMQEWVCQRISDRMSYERNPVFSQELFLPKDHRGGVAEKLIRQKPDWYEKLDAEYQSLLNEIYMALAIDIQSLAAMGLRTVIDMVCNKLVGDLGPFDKKLEALLGKGFINNNEREILVIAIDAGSASAHRGHTPKKEDLNTLLDIVEHLLKGVYVLRPASEKLKQSTPPRKHEREK